MTRTISPPPAKRVKLENTEDTNAEPNQSPANDDEIARGESEADEDNENNCSICLQSIVDRTVVPTCSHEFCFECLLVWTEQSRRCPLCSQNIGAYLIHSIRSRYDYRKRFLPPLRTSPPPSRPASNNSLIRATRQNARRRRQEREWGVRENENEEFDKLERSIAKRRWIYQHDLYAKHVASNSFTKYRPYPTPAQFAASPDLISRTTSFLRRELQVWEGLDVEFLTTLILSLMKAIDIRSESAVKLISEFLDMDEPYTPGGRHVNAEHFAHEVYCYVRSPYRDLFVYDSVVQYDTPSGITPPPDVERSRRWRPPRPTDASGQSSSAPAESSRRQRSLSRHSDEYAPVNLSREAQNSSRGQTACEEPQGFKSNLSDKAVHHSHRRGKDHPTQDEGHQRRSSAIYDHHQKYVGDKDLATDSEKYDGKGKRKANQAGSGLDTQYAQSAVSEDIMTVINSGRSESNLKRPVESPPREDTRSDQGFGVLPSGGPSGPKAQKPPRHKSLLESVQAHLAGNGGAKTAPKELRKEGNFQGQALHVRTSPEDDIDLLPQNNGIERTPLSGNSKGKAREQPTSGAFQESPSFREDGPVRMYATCLPPAATGVDRLSATPSPPPRTPATPRTKSRTTHDSHDTAINTRNSSTSHGISYNAITDAPSSSGVSGLQGERYAANLHSAEQNAVATEIGSRTSVRRPLQNHEQVSESAPRAIADRTAMHGRQIGTSDVEARLPTPLVPEFLDSLVGEGSHSKATSITFVNHPLPHATSVKSDAEAMHTKLLARLAIEKKRAHASVRADTSVDSNADKNARALQQGSRLPGSLRPEDLSTSAMAVNDGKSASGSSPGLIAQEYGEDTDPDSASGIVAEEARTREAYLRRRAQLRVRLAAERRLADGS